MVSSDIFENGRAFIKLSEYFEEFMCLESGRILETLVDEMRLGGPLDSFERAQLVPPRSPGKKSPKKRSHEETSSASSSSRRERERSLSCEGSASAKGAESKSETTATEDWRAFSSKCSGAEDVKQVGRRLHDVHLTGTVAGLSDSSKSPYDAIPRFYLPGRGMHTYTNEIKDSELSNKMAEIESFFKPFPSGIPVNTFVHVTKRLCAFPSYFNKELCKRILLLSSDMPNTTSDTTFNPLTTKIKLKHFLVYWKKEMEKFDTAERIFRLLKKPGADHILKDDLNPILQELLLFHPGLEFLSEHQDFQRKYAQAVITRIFFTVNTSRTGRISLRELRNSDLIEAFMHADEESDINRVYKFFSYEHFYVVYCHFFELDKDQDSKLNIDDFQRFNEHALSRPVIERIFQVGARAFTDGREGDFGRDGLSFSDFIYFMMAEEDKASEQAIAYWFKCIDLDGDGVLSPQEMQHFFRIQLNRVTSYGQEAVLFEDVLCQMIDMIAPPDPNAITLEDMTRPEAREASGILFDALFNLHKFVKFETRDPLQDKLKREDAFDNEWDRFCYYEYRRLSSDDEPADQTMEVEEFGAQRHGGGNWQLDDDDEYDAYGHS